jgi:hypothetical protein
VLTWSKFKTPKSAKRERSKITAHTKTRETGSRSFKPKRQIKFLGPGFKAGQNPTKITVLSREISSRTKALFKCQAATQRKPDASCWPGSCEAGVI